jgi:hypothetical protein
MHLSYEPKYELSKCQDTLYRKTYKLWCCLLIGGRFTDLTSITDMKHNKQKYNYP